MFVREFFGTLSASARRSFFVLITQTNDKAMKRTTNTKNPPKGGLFVFRKYILWIKVRKRTSISVS